MGRSSFLSLSTNPTYIDITVQILDEAIVNDMEDDSASSKITKSRISKSELATISIEEQLTSHYFIISEINMCDFVEMYYKNGSAGYWTPAATLVPGYI